jgi:hypothetical protein
MEIKRIGGKFGEWVDINDAIPASEDTMVIVAFSNGGVEMVHIQDYFDDVPNGVVDGVQQYTKLYLNHDPEFDYWMRAPDYPVKTNKWSI